MVLIKRKARTIPFGYKLADDTDYIEPVESELDGFNFFSITNRNDWSMNPNRVDLDTSTVNTRASPAQTSIILQDQIEWSQEFRLESEEGSKLDWVLGAFYADSEIKGDATRSFGVTEQTVYNLESRNIGIFASVAKDLTENDNLSLGLRYDNFEKKINLIGENVVRRRRAKLFLSAFLVFQCIQLRFYCLASSSRKKHNY